MPPLNRVTLRVPATTANLGPAFDCMGMALDLWNVVAVGPAAGPCPSVTVTGEGAGELPTNPTNLVYRAALRLFAAVGRDPGPMDVRCENAVPLERGLGSSAAAIVGGLSAANHLAGLPLSTIELLDLAIDIEGHPDNVTATIYGGARIVVKAAEGVVTAPVAVPPEINAVLYIPEGRISTAAARSVMPDRVSVEDAVFNAGRAALLVNALSSGDLSPLREATQDRLHQPYRHGLFPAMRVIIREALRAGALGAFVSGSGSTVLALTCGREMSVAYYMAEAARKANAPGRTLVTRPSAKGVHQVD